MPLLHPTESPGAIESYFPYQWSGGSTFPPIPSQYKASNTTASNHHMPLNPLEQLSTVQGCLDELAQPKDTYLEYHVSIPQSPKFKPPATRSCSTSSLESLGRQRHQRHRRTVSITKMDISLLPTSTSFPDLTLRSDMLEPTHFDYAPKPRTRAATQPVRFAEERNTCHVYQVISECEKSHMVPADIGPAHLQLGVEEDGKDIDEEPLGLFGGEDIFTLAAGERRHKRQRSSISETCITPPRPSSHCLSWLSKLETSLAPSNVTEPPAQSTVTSATAFETSLFGQEDGSSPLGLAITMTAPTEGRYRLHCEHNATSLCPADLGCGKTTETDCLAPSPEILNEGGYDVTPLEALFEWDVRHSSSSIPSTRPSPNVASYPSSPRPDLFHFEPSRQVKIQTSNRIPQQNSAAEADLNDRSHFESRGLDGAYTLASSKSTLKTGFETLRDLLSRLCTGPEAAQ